MRKRTYKLMTLLVWQASCIPFVLGGVEPKVSLSIHDAINQALEFSPRIKMAHADLQAQKEKNRAAWSDLGPRVKAEYNQVHFEERQSFKIGDNLMLVRDDVSKIGSITVAQPLTGAVALYQKARFEGAQVDLKQLGSAGVQTEVAFQTAESWLKAFQTQGQLDIAQASIVAVENQLKDAQAIERAGRMNRGDVLKLELAVSESRVRAAQMKAFKDVVFFSLKESIHLPVDKEFVLQAELPHISDLEPTLDEALKQAFENRIDLKQSQGAIEIAYFGKKLAYTQFSPSINIFAKVDKNFGELTAFNSEQFSKTYGIQLSWDIWNNGSSVFATREASSQVAKAEESVRQVESLVRLDVTSALANLRAARESLALARVAVSQASEAYRIEKARFMTGTRSGTDLVLAETSQASAEVRLITAQTDFINGQLKLQKAQGEVKPKFQ